MVIKRLALTVGTAAALVLGAAVVPASADTAPTTPNGGGYPVLRQGDKGENVRALQWLLNCKGYKFKPPGHYGPVTARAVKKFQMSSRVTPADGITGALTWDRLVSGSTKYGDRNDCVKALQVALNAYRAESDSGDLPITGYFGRQTSKSLHNYQDLRGLPISDTTGPALWHSFLSGAFGAD